MQTETTRRALLGGAGLASIALAIPGKAAARADRQAQWDVALAKYMEARAASDNCPLGHEDEDALVDRYCELMDVLIIDVRAPDQAALLFKMDLIDSRMNGFVHDTDYGNAIRADIRMLVA